MCNPEKRRLLLVAQIRQRHSQMAQMFGGPLCLLCVSSFPSQGAIRCPLHGHFHPLSSFSIHIDTDDVPFLRTLSRTFRGADTEGTLIFWAPRAVIDHFHAVVDRILSNWYSRDKVIRNWAGTSLYDPMWGSEGRCQGLDRGN